MSHRTIVIADHHKSVFVCQILDRKTGEARRSTLQSRRDELRPFLASLPGPVLVFVEACRSWEWVSDLCDDLGVEFRLINPRHMPEIANSVTAPRRARVPPTARTSESSPSQAMPRALASGPSRARSSRRSSSPRIVAAVPSVRCACRWSRSLDEDASRPHANESREVPRTSRARWKVSDLQEGRERAVGMRPW